MIKELAGQTEHNNIICGSMYEVMKCLDSQTIQEPYYDIEERGKDAIAVIQIYSNRVDYNFVFTRKNLFCYEDYTLTNKLPLIIEVIEEAINVARNKTLDPGTIKFINNLRNLIKNIKAQ